MSASTRLPDIIARDEAALLVEWQRSIAASGSGRDGRVSEADLRKQCSDVLAAVRAGLAAGGTADIATAPWAAVRESVVAITRARVALGQSPSVVARFVLSLKEPLFARLRGALATDPKALADETWALTLLVDNLGLFVTETHQAAREEVIRRQQESMLELSTPVVKLWDGVLALPLIGTLDSARTQVVMESLLQKIVETGCEVAIIDITGVPTVDTLVAQHLIKTVTAARLMGAECIISGIRPQIAQTIVHLGVDLGTVTTKASLADAFLIALTRRDLVIVRRRAAIAGR
jgi:rsbT co-antagonist protein RsbR